jgi:hypothetical protein
MPERRAFRKAKSDLLYAHERNTSLADPFLAVLPVGGAALSVLVGATGQATICSSDLTAARLDELQFDLGEGPCWDAASTRSPVLHPHLRATGTASWPLFTHAVHDDPLSENVEAVFAFPLYVGSLDIGAVDLYSSSTTPLESTHVGYATELASLASWQVLRRILVDQDSDQPEQPGAHNRREVHQATGMVLAQLGISADDAALLLRAHAFSSGRSVAEIANDIVERRLDFGPDSNRQ